LEIPSGLLPVIVAGLKPAESGSDLFDRIVKVRLKAELDSARTWSGYDPMFDFETLAGLTSPLYLATLLDSYCREFPNPFGRFAACEETAMEFEGRCNAYRLAREADSTGRRTGYISEALELCEAWQERAISDLRAMKWPLTQFDDR
jgi:hypothetical protein